MTPREYDYFMKMKKIEIMEKTRKTTVYREKQYQTTSRENEEFAPKKSFSKGCMVFAVCIIIFAGIITLAIPIQ